MKKGLCIILATIMILSMAACGAPAVQETLETTVPTADLKVTPAPEPEVTPTPKAVATPTPVPELFAPQDIFGSEIDPYSDVDFPEYFKVNAASYSQGSAKLGGKALYSLSMTAEGNTDGAIAFLADLAGLTEDEKISRTDEYNRGGFCEFQGKDGVTFTIRKTNPDDDRYEYVDGCLVEIQYNVDTADIEKYTGFVRDNYNLNALSLIAEYLDIQPDWTECDFGINLYKKEAGASVVYHVSDVDAVQRGIIDNVKTDWYDTQSGSMGLSYGILNSKIEFDSKGGAVYVTQTASVFDTPLCEYVAPENSLTKLGFGFDKEGICGVYEQHEPHYMNVAIHRPEWGESTEDWNIEYLDEINGYVLRITYNAAEGKYHMTVDKKKSGAAFDYLPATMEYTGQYPDEDTVKKMFNDAFGTQNEDFYDKPLACFEQLVRERFNLSIEELYSLPIK